MGGGEDGVGGWRAPDNTGDLSEIITNSTRPHVGGAAGHSAAATRGRGGAAKKNVKLPALNKKRKKSTSGSVRSSSTAGRKKAGSRRGGGRAASVSSRGTSRGTSRGGARSRGGRSSVKSGRSSRASKNNNKKKRGGRGASASSKSGAKRRGSTKRGSKKVPTFAAAVESLDELHNEGRKAIVVEEEMELEGYSSMYNVFVMEIVRYQVGIVNKRQRELNETFEALRSQGVPIADGDGMNIMIEKLRDKLRSDAVDEMHDLRNTNAGLQELLEEKRLELEKKSGEVEVMRNTIARKLARREAENESLRAEVQAKLHAVSLDVNRMKKELGCRIDIACASIRTPKYNTSLRSMQDLVAEVQEEIQEHHDLLSKLILSIGAKDTFLKDESDTMHSNLPIQYRVDLRKLNQDHLLNILDVLSFQEGVVDTVGKALYVLLEVDQKNTNTYV